MEEYTYRYLETSEKENVREVLLDLEEWFGLPESLERYVQESQNRVVIGCFSNDTLLGFLTLKPTSKVTMEVYVMGIYKQYRRHHIGNTLMDMAFKIAREEGYHYMQVKTLDPAVRDKDYLETYAFYCAKGFEPVEVLPLWDEWNPCMLMICKL